MPYDGAGNYSLPAGYLAVTDTTIEVSQHNPPFEDIAAALSSVILRSGVAPMTGQLLLTDGTAGLPGLSFNGDVNTGLRRVSADTIALVTGGTDRATLASTGLTITGTVLAASGTAALPSYSFSADPNTGMWQLAADTLGWATGGAERMRLASAGLTVTGNVTATTNFVASGGAGAFCSTGANSLFLRPNGVGSAVGQTQVAPTGDMTVAGVMTANGGARVNNGSAGAPSMSFSTDPDMGFYLAAASEMAWASGGSEIVRMTDTMLGVGVTEQIDPDVNSFGCSFSADGKLQAQRANDSPARFIRTGSNGTILQAYIGNTQGGGLTATGTTCATFDSSDKRLKTNLREFDPGALIDAVELYEYEWIKTGKIGWGPMAQDLMGVAPWAVVHDKDADFWGVTPSTFVWPAVRELQLLRKRVAALEAHSNH